jgi:hypothetical protein
MALCPEYRSVSRLGCIRRDLCVALCPESRQKLRLSFPWQWRDDSQLSETRCLLVGLYPSSRLLLFVLPLAMAFGMLGVPNRIRLLGL